MIYIEQYQTLTSIPEKLNSGDKLYDSYRERTLGKEHKNR